MSIQRLSQDLVDQARCPEGKLRVELCDSELPGLLLEVRASGRATYRVRYKDAAGQTRYASLGHFHTELLATGLAPATCDHHLKLLKRMFNLALDWGIFPGPNPVARVPMFNADNKRQTYLADDQVHRLVAVLRTDGNRPVCLIAMFLLSTGARLNEALSVTWDQIDEQNRVWRIPALNSKSKRIRSVPLNDSAMDVVEELRALRSSGYLFLKRARTRLGPGSGPARGQCERGPARGPGGRGHRQFGLALRLATDRACLR